MGGEKESKHRTRSKKMTVGIEPHCWIHLTAFLERANSDPLRIIPKIKLSDVINDALALYLGISTQRHFSAETANSDKARAGTVTETESENEAEGGSFKPFRQSGELALVPEKRKVEFGPRTYTILKAAVEKLNESPAHEHSPVGYSDIVNKALEDYLPSLSGD